MISSLISGSWLRQVRIVLTVYYRYYELLNIRAMKKQKILYLIGAELLLVMIPQNSEVEFLSLALVLCLFLIKDDMKDEKSHKKDN